MVFGVTGFEPTSLTPLVDNLGQSGLASLSPSFFIHDQDIVESIWKKFALSINGVLSTQLLKVKSKDHSQHLLFHALQNIQPYWIYLPKMSQILALPTISAVTLFIEVTIISL